MIDVNPFAELSQYISYTVMGYFVILMLILVIVGTILDMIHKKSAQYFFESANKSKQNAKREISGGEKVSIALKTFAEDVAASGEFCNPKRRIAHLLTMYGFILFVAMTAVIIFNPSSNATILPILWHIGAIMLFIGSWWFWLFIRVDVVAEGSLWYEISYMDLFSLSLMATSAFALIWSYATLSNAFGWLFFSLFVAASVVLFGGVFWSKFAHMFFKPAAALQRRLAEADGSRDNLPEPADEPAKFGLGIKREGPRHY